MRSMPRITVQLKNKDQTLQGMQALTEKFYTQLGGLSRLPLQTFFDKVRKYPYKRDVKGTEQIASPAVLMKNFPAWDCKKKAIMIASWLRSNNIPFRFVAVSEIPSRKIHHVFPQGKIKLPGETVSRWRNVDATYPSYKLFERKNKITRAEILERKI